MEIKNECDAVLALTTLSFMKTWLQDVFCLQRLSTGFHTSRQETAEQRN